MRPRTSKKNNSKPDTLNTADSLRAAPYAQVVQQRLPSLISHPILFAHRGARAHAPENTLQAFELALRLGASGLETDAWLTADNVVVLDHDGVLTKWLRKVPISSVLRAELPEHIPSLEEMFAHCGTNFELSIDVKDQKAFQLVASIARQAEFQPARLWLCHPDNRVLAAVRESVPEVRLVDSTRLVKMKEGIERRAAADRAAGIDCVNMHHSDWTGGLTTLVHKFGLMAFGWDAQHAHILDAALRMGLDAVYSDHTDKMVDAKLRLDRPDDIESRA